MFFLALLFRFIILSDDLDSSASSSITSDDSLSSELSTLHVSSYKDYLASLFGKSLSIAVLHGDVASLAAKSKYHGLFNRVFVSHLQLTALGWEQFQKPDTEKPEQKQETAEAPHILKLCSIEPKAILTIDTIK